PNSFLTLLSAAAHRLDSSLRPSNDHTIVPGCGKSTPRHGVRYVEPPLLILSSITSLHIPHTFPFLQVSHIPPSHSFSSPRSLPLIFLSPAPQPPKTTRQCTLRRLWCSLPSMGLPKIRHLHLPHLRWSAPRSRSTRILCAEHNNGRF